MDNLRFKCKVCNSYVKMNKSVLNMFSDWAYYGGMEWSDYKEDVPDLSMNAWQRSNSTPIVNESRALFVTIPFDESIGNTFLVLFEPALIACNGWEDCYNNDIDKCAIVRCKFERILKRNEYSAWITVSIKEVIYLDELCNYYTQYETDKNIYLFDVLHAHMGLPYRSDKWLVTHWGDQGDWGKDKWFYIDRNGIHHLVMQSLYTTDESILYIGNVVNMNSSDELPTTKILP